MNTTATARTDFAVRLFDQLARTNAVKNRLLSPFSIQAGLGMGADGAKGETRKVLSDLIGAPAVIEEQNRRLAKSIGPAKGRGEGPMQFVTANALWGQQGCQVRAD